MQASSWCFRTLSAVPVAAWASTRYMPGEWENHDEPINRRIMVLSVYGIVLDAANGVTSMSTLLRRMSV